jgi:Ca2+-binding RTX toxin-like protein
MVGGANNDTLNASAYTTASVTLSGDAGNDSLLSGGGNDSISGGDGADFLCGAETLTGGGGEIDTLTGGSGVDTFVLGDLSNNYYTAGDSSEYALITDFEIGTDLMQLKIGGISDPIVGGPQLWNTYNGYHFKPSESGIIGGANSYLYRDFGITGPSALDVLVAAIKTTNGVALTTDDLASNVNWL